MRVDEERFDIKAADARASFTAQARDLDVIAGDHDLVCSFEEALAWALVARLVDSSVRGEESKAGATSPAATSEAGEGEGWNDNGPYSCGQY